MNSVSKGPAPYYYIQQSTKMLSTICTLSKLLCIPYDAIIHLLFRLKIWELHILINKKHENILQKWTTELQIMVLIQYNYSVEILSKEQVASHENLVCWKSFSVRQVLKHPQCPSVQKHTQGILWSKGILLQ